MTKKSDNSLQTKETARERRLKEALRANLQRRRAKAHASRQEISLDERDGDVQNQETGSVKGD